MNRVKKFLVELTWISQMLGMGAGDAATLDTATARLKTTITRLVCISSASIRQKFQNLGQTEILKNQREVKNIIMKQRNVDIGLSI